MSPEAAHEALRQAYVGRDFEPAEKLILKTPAKALIVPAGAPYSIATNVAHADVWQRVWLARLEGTPVPEIKGQADDFPLISAEEWPAIRERFLAGFRRAMEIAASRPFEHALDTDQAAVKKLLQIAVHNTYHLGQVALLKRLINAARA